MQVRCCRNALKQNEKKPLSLQLRVLLSLVYNLETIPLFAMCEAQPNRDQGMDAQRTFIQVVFNQIFRAIVRLGIQSSRFQAGKVRSETDLDSRLNKHLAAVRRKHGFEF